MSSGLLSTRFLVSLSSSTRIRRSQPRPRRRASIRFSRRGWYLLALINEILDLAQIESGKLALSREPTSLAEVILECQTMIEPQGQKRGITMTFPDA